MHNLLLLLCVVY